MSEVLLTGERLQPGSQLFGVDLARHRAAYVYANLNARGDRLLDLGCGTGYGTAEPPLHDRMSFAGAPFDWRRAIGFRSLRDVAAVLGCTSLMERYL